MLDYRDDNLAQDVEIYMTILLMLGNYLSFTGYASSAVISKKRGHVEKLTLENQFHLAVEDYS